MSYSIPSNKLAAVALAASTEKTRYYLQGVYVEASPQRVKMTATNGHILLTAKHENENADAPLAFSIIIPSETIALALKAKVSDLTLVADGDSYKLGAISFKPIDGTFPDYLRVIPKAAPKGFSIDGMWFQSQYLALMAKAAKLLGASGSPNTGEAFTIFPDGGSPALVQFTTVPDVLGVIMPIRTQRDAFTTPTWAVK